MTLMLELTQEEEARLRERAARQGQDAPAYALDLVRQGLLAETAEAPPKHSVMEFYGVGREALRNRDVDTYIRQMRDEWDAPEDER